MVPLIAVAGKGRNCPDWLKDQARAVGAVLASVPNIGLVTGGLGGVMDAAAQGYAGGGGELIVGLLPGEEYRVEGNVSKFLTIEVDTGQPTQVRNWVLANTCSAMVVLYGSHGTWQETAFALDLGKKVWGLGERRTGFPRAHKVTFPGVEYVTDIYQLLSEVQAWAA